MVQPRLKVGAVEDEPAPRRGTRALGAPGALTAGDPAARGDDLAEHVRQPDERRRPAGGRRPVPAVALAGPRARLHRGRRVHGAARPGHARHLRPRRAERSGAPARQGHPVPVGERLLHRRNRQRGVHAGVRDGRHGLRVRVGPQPDGPARPRQGGRHARRQLLVVVPGLAARAALLQPRTPVQHPGRPRDGRPDGPRGRRARRDRPARRRLSVRLAADAGRPVQHDGRGGVADRRAGRNDPRPHDLRGRRRPYRRRDRDRARRSRSRRSRPRSGSRRSPCPSTWSGTSTTTRARPSTQINKRRKAFAWQDEPETDLPNYVPADAPDELAKARDARTAGWR